MHLSPQQLLHLPVETESGVRLGTVAGVVVDTEQHVVAHYVVRASPLPRFLSPELLIAPSQVVRLTDEKMVVADATLPAAAAATPAT